MISVARVAYLGLSYRDHEKPASGGFRKPKPPLVCAAITWGSVDLTELIVTVQALRRGRLVLKFTALGIGRHYLPLLICAAVAGREVGLLTLGGQNMHPSPVVDAI